MVGTGSLLGGFLRMSRTADFGAATGSDLAMKGADTVGGESTITCPGSRKTIASAAIKAMLTRAPTGTQIHRQDGGSRCTAPTAFRISATGTWVKSRCRWTLTTSATSSRQRGQADRWNSSSAFLRLPSTPSTYAAIQRSPGHVQPRLDTVRSCMFPNSIACIFSSRMATWMRSFLFYCTDTIRCFSLNLYFIALRSFFRIAASLR